MFESISSTLRIVLRSKTEVIVEDNAGQIWNRIKAAYERRSGDDWMEITGSWDGIPWPISVRFQVDDVDYMERQRTERGQFYRE